MILTTTARTTAPQQSRAEDLARRWGQPVVPRRGALDAMLAHHDAALAYVVGRDHEWITDGTDRVALDAGLLHAHLAVGRAHPLVRALGPVQRVFDATLGLAHDAIHVAAVTGARVDGIEISPALYALAEAGLPRLAHEGIPGAERVFPHPGDSATVLGDLGRADAVLLSPMFDRPRAAPPGFSILRHLAHDDPLDAAWLAAARRVAPRVVIKARRGQPLPPFAAPHHRETLRGKAVDYWVFGPT